jgi:ribosomal protein S5
VDYKNIVSEESQQTTNFRLKLKYYTLYLRRLRKSRKGGREIVIIGRILMGIGNDRGIIGLSSGLKATFLSFRRLKEY